MYNGLQLFKMASALAGHASARQAQIARNLAHADTPGFKAQDLAPFADTFQATPESSALRSTRPGHLAAPLDPSAFRTQHAAMPGDMSPDGNSVSVEREMMRASEVQHSHALAMSAYRSGLEMLRAGLGRIR